jgi:hypothetical protein
MTASLPSVSLADSLIQALRQPGQERLLDLVRNPLRLSLLCQTWNGRSLPDTQAQLYENYLKKVYTWNHNLDILNDQATRCRTNITELKKQLNQQLGELAKAALDLPQEHFRLSQRLVEQYLGDEIDNKSLCYLALRLGWLNRVGLDSQSQAIFAFYHATFQEYFAALAVDDWDYFLPQNHVNFPVAGKEYRIFEPQWKQVILLWLGREDVGDEEKEGFIEKLVNFKDGCGEWNFEKVDRGFYEYRAYFLAAAGSNEFNACSLADKVVRQVVKWGIGYFNINIESQEWVTFLKSVEKGAREVIRKTIRQRAISELLDIFKHCPEEYIPLEAAFSLDEITQENLIVNAALDRLQKTTQVKLAGRGVGENLGQLAQGIEDEKTCKASIEIFDPALVRLQEITGLKLIGRGVGEILSPLKQGISEDIPALVRLLEFSEDENTRKIAVESLGRIAQANPIAIRALVQLLETTENENTRKIAVESLGRIAQANPIAIEALVQLLKTTENEDICSSAAESLGRIAQANLIAIEALVQLLKTTENKDTRRSAAESLEKILTTPEQYAGVASALKDNLSGEAYQNNFDRFEEHYKVVWNCAANLSYPQFYQVWHRNQPPPNPPTLLHRQQ